MSETDTKVSDRPSTVEIEDAPSLPAASARPAPRVQVVQPMEGQQQRGQTQQVERVIVRHSDLIGDLMAGIADAQAEDGYGDIEKSRKARVESKRTGVNYEYTYETLADVLAATRPFLAKHGVAVMQFPFPGNGTVTIRTMLAKGEQWIYNDLAATTENNDPQSVGSGISYLRRYALKSITGVAAEDEDDDGKQAQGNREPVHRAQRQSSNKTADIQTAGATVTYQRAADTKPVPPQPPQPVGQVKTLERRANGVLVELETGFVAAATDPEVIGILDRHEKDGVVLELTTKPSSNPAKFAPLAYEVAVRR